VIQARARRPARERLDVLLHRRGLARSRSAAQALVMSGRVEVEGRRVDKAGTPCASDARITVLQTGRNWVSRGGAKLSGALDALNIDPAAMTVLDVGASTGGFTDCLLQRGAARVVALDVGHGQIDWSLRGDPRVDVIEGVNARHLEPGMLPAACLPFDLVVIDVSFISLRLILPPIARLVNADASVLPLVKPQFEAGPAQVGRGGIVQEAATRRGVICAVAQHARDAGFAVLGAVPSMLRGAEGNREYFLHLAPGTGGWSPEECEKHAEAITVQETD